MWTVGLLAFCFLAASCDTPRCGPLTAEVARVVDGDTIELISGELVRYILIDTPELGQCFYQQATQANELLLKSGKIQLVYEDSCFDTYGRLLAYVYSGDVLINYQLVETGYAKTFFVPPHGRGFREQFIGAQAKAQSEGWGQWGQCRTSAL